MSSTNPLWGAPRIVGELGKIGIEVTKSTVEKHMVRHRKPYGRLDRAANRGGLPWQDPPKYLLRDRDKIYGKAFRKRVSADRGGVIEVPDVGGLHHHYEHRAA